MQFLYRLLFFFFFVVVLVLVLVDFNVNINVICVLCIWQIWTQFSLFIYLFCHFHKKKNTERKEKIFSLILLKNFIFFIVIYYVCEANGCRETVKTNKHFLLLLVFSTWLIFFFLLYRYFYVCTLLFSLFFFVCVCVWFEYIYVKWGCHDFSQSLDRYYSKNCCRNNTFNLCFSCTIL